MKIVRCFGVAVGGIMRHNMAQHHEFNIRITDSDSGIVGNVFTHNLRD